MSREAGETRSLQAGDRERLDAIRRAATLAELVEITDTDSSHDAYFAAKAEWKRLRGRELDTAGFPSCAGGRDGDREGTDGGGGGGGNGGGDGDDERDDGGTPAADTIPGSCIEIDDRRFHVHGITHAGTDAERSYLRERVGQQIERGASVYCEQGIRRLYFGDFDAVCVMDDYRWAMQSCRDFTAGGDGQSAQEYDGVSEGFDSLTDSFREAAFSLIDAGGDVYGERFRSALGDVAAAFLTSHESVATGRDFESFTANRRAAADPEKLADLQRYYERAFLPQPLEREWLRRHDPELEVVTHARNERMADYAVTHADSTPDVHVIVGAAHQPGVYYYLRRIRDGDREPTFDPV